MVEEPIQTVVSVRLASLNMETRSNKVAVGEVGLARSLHHPDKFLALDSGRQRSSIMSALSLSMTTI